MHIIGCRRSLEPTPKQEGRKTIMKLPVTKVCLIAGCLLFAGVTQALAQEKENENPPSFAQIVALDECDPTTFNAALGPGFCKNVTLGAFTTLKDLFAKAAIGKP